MAVCRDCGFVFNAAFDERNLSYGEHYDNTQSHSEVFTEYMETLVDHLVNKCGVRGLQIVEVGCGKGEFLKMLVAQHPANRGIGFDASYIGASDALGGRLRFERRMYGPDCVNVPADVVVCRHVIEHVANPLELLGAVREALSSSPGARVFFETPCVEWIFANNVIWDIFYEHCSLFTANSLALTFRSAGFRVADVRRVFGEQYLWIEASISGSNSFTPPLDAPVASVAAKFAREARAVEDKWTEKIDALRIRGKIAVWGAGAKGASFVDLVDRSRKRIDCVVDINPVKQGHFIPGTGHPIVSPSQLADRQITSAIMMNPNYLTEVETLLARDGITMQLVT